MYSSKSDVVGIMKALSLDGKFKVRRGWYHESLEFGIYSSKSDVVGIMKALSLACTVQTQTWLVS